MKTTWWSGTGSNCRPSAFQEVYHPESTYLEKPPTAQLTRIDSADGLFSVSLTRITSVPECAVSSVGSLWGSAAVSLSCGVSVGLAEAPDWAGRPGTGTKSRRLPDPNDHFPVAQCHQGDLAGCSNSAPIADYLRIRALWHLRGVEHRSASSGRPHYRRGNRAFARRLASGTCGVFAARADTTDETWVTLRGLRRHPARSRRRRRPPGASRPADLRPKIRALMVRRPALEVQRLAVTTRGAGCRDPQWHRVVEPVLDAAASREDTYRRPGKPAFLYGQVIALSTHRGAGEG